MSRCPIARSCGSSESAKSPTSRISRGFIGGFVGGSTTLSTTTVTDGFMFNTPASPVAKPGAYVVLKAHMNLVCAVSSCPYDLVGPGWNINAPEGSTEILIELD